MLKDKVYDEAKVPIWVDQICDKCMQSLTELNKPFKYIGDPQRIPMRFYPPPASCFVRPASRLC